ncbi:MAG: peptidoglycan DD-metalloendopeptidase family protein [Burkholderiales bacterium]|nr:peptidoglycan DD-metalloendopeptidase family protein [Anaerolineae bacterium]
MASKPAVPKPSSAGQGRVALTKMRGTYVNLRNGPGTDYTDIGDIRLNTLVVYYLNSRTADGWVWLEQYGKGGWVSTTVISFEDTNAGVPTTPGSNTPTPYDGKVMVWHWKGDTVVYNTIEELAQAISRTVPNVKALAVKTSDFTTSTGAKWMGNWDTKAALAITGPEAIDRWVQVLTRYGLDFHAWAVPRGVDTNAEADLIIEACKRPGVKSMILDVEPYEGFWQGGKAGIRPLMTRVRRALPGTFHIGICVDPRQRHYETIYPAEWLPFVNSVHTMSYWGEFRRAPDEVMDETYRVWGGYGRPIIPILQGNTNTVDMQTAFTVSTQRYGAKGVSWWRLGVIGPVEWSIVNQPIRPATTTPPPPPPPPPPMNQYGTEIVLRPNDTGFAVGTYTNKQEFSTYTGTWGWQAYYTYTESISSTAYANWRPSLPASGRYEMAVFVPARHATTRNARYKIHGVKGSTAEIVVGVDQSRYSNQWVSLGVFEFDKNTVNAGSVFLNDLTGEGDLQIAFDALRWRQVIASAPPISNTMPANTNGVIVVNGVYYADGYDAPIGTAAERATNTLWPGNWYDASPFGVLYFPGTPNAAYHTGADLNLPGNADRDSTVYSIASGVVVFASYSTRSWGDLVVVRHDPLYTNQMVTYARYAHVADIKVKVGDRVKRGDALCKVGNARGLWAYHLHFDLSPTTMLETDPGHWPGTDEDTVLRHYIDPREFVVQNRPRRT